MSLLARMRCRVLASVIALFSAAVPAVGGSAGTALPRATPESQGISSAGLQALYAEADAERLGIHGLMVLRHGKVVAEGWWAPYTADDPHELYSLSKSFTSTAIGLLQAEGRINIHDKLLSFFRDEAPSDATDNLKKMRLRDLLMMSTGQQQEDVDRINIGAADGSGTRQFLAAPVKQRPGTLFYYNTPASYMLSATVQKVTGQTVRDYLVPRLFEPLGIATPAWDLSPEGYNIGGSGLHLRTEDIAKFGQLLLQRGEWNGRRLVPAEWVDQATARQTSNGSDPDSDWEQGYGFQFWRCTPGFYRGDGAFGQFAIVMPQYDAVVAINSGSDNMAGIMKMLWTRLLPELRAAALSEDHEAQSALQARLAHLRLPLTSGTAKMPLAAKISGRVYQLEPNDERIEAVTLEFAKSGTATLKIRQAGGDETVEIGRDSWSTCQQTKRSRVSTSGAWTANDTYTIQTAVCGTPYVLTSRHKFAGDALIVEREVNVSFRKDKLATLRGKSTRPNGDQ
jgi:CubicO group peptidase (beta-lactamase class C family)